MLKYFSREGDGNKGGCMNKVKGEDECELEVDVEGEREGEGQLMIVVKKERVSLMCRMGFRLT